MMAGYPAALLRDPVCLLATGFGLGCSPRAPGTLGSLLGLPLAWFLNGLPMPWSGLAWLAVAVLGVGICSHAGGRCGITDHPGIVWDEIAGMALVLLPVQPGLLPYVLGFLLFRGFDIAKPWPIGWLDRRLKSGLGVMLDDVLAGLFAMLLLYVGLLVFRPAHLQWNILDVLGAVG